MLHVPLPCFFFSSRRRHTRCLSDWSSDVCSSDLYIPHEKALGMLNEALDEVDLTVWIVLDRLDEAFQGFPSVEIPALRALFRTYLDLNAYPRIRLKLFVRNDVFRKVT